MDEKREIMTKSQIRQWLQNSVLARQSKLVPPKLEKRIKKWYRDKLIQNYQGPDLKLYLEDLEEGYWQIKPWPVLLKTTQKSWMHKVGDDYRDGLVIWIILPYFLKSVLATNARKFVTLFEEEVLKPAGYQVVDHRIPEKVDPNNFEIILNITNPKARTKVVEKSKFLYHFAHPDNEKSISRKGLIPKDGPKDFRIRKYKSRIYLIVTPTKSWNGYRILSGLPRSLQDDFVIFRIDTPQVQSIQCI